MGLSSFILLPAVEEVGKSAAVEVELISNQSGFNQSCLSDNLLHNSAVDRISLGSIFRNLKYFLYLGNPYEENYQFEHEIPNYDIELFPFIVGFLLLEWFTLWYQGRPIPKLADASTSASLMMNMQICRILCRGAEHTLYHYIYKNFHMVDLPWHNPVMWYFAALAVDFCYYWGHRSTHVINALWATHKIHHSSEVYLLINAFRVPAFTDVILCIFYAPLALCVPPVVFLVHHQFNLMYQFWLHTALVGKLGPIEWIFNTPSHHRVHHGRNKYCLDKNFGSWLIIWDRMFGTFQEELSDEEVLYGCVDQVKSHNPLYLEVFHFGSIYEKWQSVDGWKNKIFSVIKGPGWSPGSPWTGHMDQVPEALPRTDVDEKDHSSLWYAHHIAHLLIAVLIYAIIGDLRNTMPYTTIACHLSFSVFTVINIGMFYDRSKLVPAQEFIRCGFFLLYSQGGIPLLTNAISAFGLTEILSGQLELYVYVALRSYFFLSALLWLPSLSDWLAPRLGISHIKKID